MDKFLPFLYENKQVKEKENYLYLEVSPIVNYTLTDEEEKDENKIIILEII